MTDIEKFFKIKTGLDNWTKMVYNINDGDLFMICVYGNNYSKNISCNISEYYDFLSKERDDKINILIK